MCSLTQGVNAAAPAAQSALDWGKVATATDSTAQLLAGVGQAQSYSYQAQVARNNAELTRASASNAAQTSGFEESVTKAKSTQLTAEQKAIQASSGVDIAVGSPAAVRESSQAMGVLDAAMMHFNASRAAFGSELEVKNFEAQAGLDKRAASNARLLGLSKSLSSIISGSTALQSKGATFALSGARG